MSRDGRRRHVAAGTCLFMTVTHHMTGMKSDIGALPSLSYDHITVFRGYEQQLLMPSAKDRLQQERPVKAHVGPDSALQARPDRSEPEGRKRCAEVRVSRGAQPDWLVSIHGLSRSRWSAAPA